MVKKKILVIEDEAVCQQLLGITLQEREDIDLIVAGDGVQGIQLAVSEKPDLIFLDLMLPTLDGFQVARVIKGIPKLASIPIIVLSARAGKEGEKKILEIGCNEFISKPFKTAQIKAVVERYLPS